MENTQIKHQAEQTGSTKQNKKHIVLIVVLAIVALLAAVLAVAFGLRVSKLTSLNNQIEWCGTATEGVELPKLPAESVKAGPCGDYPFTSTRKVNYGDVAGKTKSALRIMRNEIYARHGYIFESDDLTRHFSKKGWYHPATRSVVLSSIEKYNVNFIERHENGAEPCGDYPFTSIVKLTDDDALWEMSLYELRIMRNEIYARHGYIFDDAEMRKHFMSKSWYVPVTKNVQLSKIEKYNVDFIKQYEK